MDPVAQFCSITGVEVDTANQYLAASDNNVESAIALFFAAEGATGHTAPAASNTQTSSSHDNVRERIQGTEDRLVDPEVEFMLEQRRQQRPQRRRGIFNQDREGYDQDSRLSAHERRLANLFRPPFDILEQDADFESAKDLAQQKQRWLLVNVQDPTEFACQRVNRDLWREESVKDIVRENFVFVQYDRDSYDGEVYSNLYNVGQLPHIGILDPWTGEQQKVWECVPEMDVFLEFIVDFLGPATLSSEGASARATPRLVQQEASAPPVQETAPFEPEPVQATTLSPIDEIEPQETPEPAPGPGITRIQFKTADGRVVRRFALESSVRDLYAFAKHSWPPKESLTLTSDRRNLEKELDKSLAEANLANSVVLVDLS